MPEEYPGQPVPRRPLVGVAICCMLGIACGVLFPGLEAHFLFPTAVAALVVSFAGSWVAQRFPSAPHGSIFSPPLSSSSLPSSIVSLAGSVIRRLLSGVHLFRSVVCHPSSVVNIRWAVVCSAFSLIGLYLAIVLTAWLTVALEIHHPSGCELAALMDRPREGVELVGVITDDPLVRLAYDGTNHIWNFPVRVAAIRRLPDWQTARGMVQVRLNDQAGCQPPHYGERWLLTGALVDNARFPEPRPVLEWIKNRYAFDADSSASVCLAAGQGSRLMAWCFKGRRKAADCLARGIDHRPEIAGLLQALLLGYRQELPDAIRRDFIATGTYHIFAISGQHVAILALFIIVVLQAQRVCRVRWFLYVAPVLAAFTISTGLSSSAVRGCLMALLVFLGPLLRRKPDLPSAMALAAILILAVDPFQLFDYGFLLSFGVVAGLIVFCPPMLKWIEPWLEPDPWRLEPERPPVRLWRHAARLTALLLVSSLAAWLVSTPFIARWFNLVSPIALLANLIVIPISTLVLLAGCLSVLCGLCLPWLGEVFNFANVVLVSFLLFVTHLMARIPWGYFYVASPPVWALLVWFGTLLAWLPGWGMRRLRLVGPAILAVAFFGSMIVNQGGISADITNIGSVPVCLIQAPRTAPLLVHTGARFYGRRAAQTLHQQGVNRLGALILPAADERHAGGALNILATFRVKELWCTSPHSRSPVFRQALAEAGDRRVPIREFAKGAADTRRDAMGWRYQAVSNGFQVRRGETVLAFGWGRTSSGQSVPDTVTVTCPSSTGPPMVCRIRCVEPGEELSATNSVDGVPETGLAPNRGIRVHLDSSGCRVEQILKP